MRYIRYVFMASLAIVLVTVALANRTVTELNLLPTELAGLIGFNLSIATPVFVVFFVGTTFGVLIGFVWEWLREYKHRAEVTRKSRELRRAEREISKLKSEKYQDKDGVLALLDEPAT
jgi:putative membrane protein